MNYQELEKYLFKISDEKFANFSKSLSNSEYISIGVKNPILRSIIKEHIKDEDLRLEDFKLGQYLEVDFIYFGLALSRINNVKEQLDFLKQNIFKAKSWAITDCVTTYIKKLTFDDYWDFFLMKYDSIYTYDRRTAYVLGLKLYKEEKVLNVLSKMKNNEEYMVMMAEAWLLSTIAINYPDEVYDYLKKCEDIKLVRKSISKINESFRFDEKTKNKFKALRDVL